MKIIANTGGIVSTNCYLVADEVAKQAVLFDAPNDTTAPLLDEAQRRGWDITGLWLTHGHFDHVADHAIVTGHFPRARVLIHPADVPKLAHPNDGPFPLPFVIPPGKADQVIADGQVLSLGSIVVHVLHTPGHCAGHVSYHFPQEKVLVGGDLIICGAVGRTDLPDSDAAALDASIRRVMLLPPETRLLPGHGDISTLGDERRSNPYVQEALRNA